MATAANRVTQSTKLQVSAAVIEAARNDLQQHTLHVTTAFYCSSVFSMQLKQPSQTWCQQCSNRVPAKQ